MPIPLLRAPPTALGAISAGLTVGAAALALVVLARALLRGRREAVGFVGLALLAVAVVWDALRNLGWVAGPPVAPFGFAAFVNGVIMTLLGRFTDLRGQLEGRARHLKDRTQKLAHAYEELRAAQDELVRKGSSPPWASSPPWWPTRCATPSPSSPTPWPRCGGPASATPIARPCSASSTKRALA